MMKKSAVYALSRHAALQRVCRAHTVGTSHLGVHVARPTSPTWSSTGSRPVSVRTRHMTTTRARPLSQNGRGLPAVAAFSSTASPAGVPSQDFQRAAAQPTRKQLWIHAFNCAIPMVGFGFMDNMVMIQAGDFIDSTLGVTLGLTTLTAAAMGQVVSDTTGVLFGGSVEAFASRLGLPSANLNTEQLKQGRTKRFQTLGAALGVICGCFLGMTSLLFMDLDKKERLERQKELQTLFDTIMEEPREQLGVEEVALWLLDEKADHIWSRNRTGKLPSKERMNKMFKMYDLDNDGVISQTELVHTLKSLGWDVRTEQVRSLFDQADTNSSGQIDEQEFETLMALIHREAEVHLPLSKHPLQAQAIKTRKPVVLDHAFEHEAFQSHQYDKLQGRKTRQLLIYPLVDPVDKEKVWGTLHMVNKTDKTAFNETDMKIATILANHATIFIRKAYGVSNE